MKAPFSLCCFLAASVTLHAADTALRFPEEQAAWNTIAARFTEAPKITADKTRTQYAVNGLKPTALPAGVTPPKGFLPAACTASIFVDNASGHVTDVVANSGYFGDEDFKTFGAFSELRNLTLFHNSGFTGAGISYVTGLKKLDKITLAGGSLEDAGMVQLAKLPALREARLYHDKYTDEGIAAFKNNPTLESISLGPQWTSRQTDKSIAVLATCPKLKKLTVDMTWLTWEGGLKHLAARQTPLTELDLVNCIIEPAEVEKLRQATPTTKITWKGLGSGAEEIQKPWIKPVVEQWIPKELVARVLEEGAKMPKTQTAPK